MTLTDFTDTTHLYTIVRHKKGCLSTVELVIQCSWCMCQSALGQETEPQTVEKG